MKRSIIAFVALTLASCSSGLAIDIGTQPAAKAKTAIQDVLKASKDGFLAMRAVHAARIAIFNGDPKEAMAMMVQAKESLDIASKDEAMFVKDVKALAGAKADPNKPAAADWIPIDGRIALTDSFVSAPEKKAHIDKANEHFKSGRSKEAVEELRLGNIDVNYTRIMMSLSATKQCVVDATQLANEQKYYEANLALKAAEDALIVDSTGLIGIAEDKTPSKDKTDKVAPIDKAKD